MATTTCQTCYAIEVFDFDTSHGFRAGCMPKNLCIPHNNEQIFGRSSSTVQINCCDTDRCRQQQPLQPPPRQPLVQLPGLPLVAGPRHNAGTTGTVVITMRVITTPTIVTEHAEIAIN
ncbi:uncharacterized protein LOC127881936 isoform X2 [Dreissena polymorpha]|uniref:uncharacterized protein LOC127881936 isoform X2 n=1 Tax=Dreissena polymorpha TaxID=45954 RepID=UPI002264FA99|nr:uncharacterized protein LOC127881936 isoform X2 [Dreissena polymorpha]